LFAIATALHADAERHQQLMKQVESLLQQFDPPVSTAAIPAWHPRETGEQLLLQVTAFLQQFNLPVATPLLLAWHPRKAGVRDLSPLRKVRRIEGRAGDSKDIVSRLKATVIGRVYQSHLKQLPFVRGAVIWIWRNAYPIYVKQISTFRGNRKTKRWHPLIKLAKYTESKGLTTTQLVNAVVVETPTPRVFPESDQGYLESPHDRYNAPAIYVATISDGIIYGGTNLILTKDGVICHDLYDFERDYTSEELHGRTLIDPKPSRIRWMLHDEVPERLPAAAAFVDACATNYAHWLTEVLPRIAAFCAEEQFNGIPIVVNDGLHKNIMESLFLVVGSEREIITLTIGRALAVDKLYLTSVAGYVPFERRTSKLSDHSHGVFSPQAFELMRNQVATFAEKLPEQGWPEKIYLRRNSDVRKITNVAEIEALLVSRGFAIVDPEKLTFLQQVRLFKYATTIFSPTGAALSNAIFCSPGTQVTVLMAKHKNMTYRYWSNMLTPIGIDVSYILGNIVDNSSHGMHGDFEVDVTDFVY
jgi:capsular polysaccharide biosynthesis protein